jgi:hypothetical protein
MSRWAERDAPWHEALVALSTAVQLVGLLAIDWRCGAGAVRGRQAGTQAHPITRHAPARRS